MRIQKTTVQSEHVSAFAVEMMVKERRRLVHNIFADRPCLTDTPLI